jgi:hypothetical protein
MKSKFTVALAVCVLGSLLGASLADAHYLSGSAAYNRARADTRATAQELADRTGKTIGWDVRNPCSQRTAHRWVCDAVFYVNSGQRYCTFKIIVQFASRTSYALKTKAVGSNCVNRG